MPVLIDRAPETGVNCLIWLGRVTKAEALALPGQIDPARPEFGGGWISYFDSRADLSDLDPACLMELRDRLRPVVAALAAKGEFRMILASNSTYNDPLVAMWRLMTVSDPAYASNPVVVHSLAAAARALGLSPVDVTASAAGSNRKPPHPPRPRAEPATRSALVRPHPLLGHGRAKVPAIQEH